MSKLYTQAELLWEFDDSSLVFSGQGVSIHYELETEIISAIVVANTDFRPALVYDWGICCFYGNKPGMYLEKKQIAFCEKFISNFHAFSQTDGVGRRLFAKVTSQDISYHQSRS